MKYIIYIGIAVLALWAVWYLARNIGRQLRGKCAPGCGGDCAHCGQTRRKSREGEDHQ